ncbi:MULTISPECIES: response regulator [Acidobacteriaceae]|uniref:response regulator n=1 Tax=Acidobacteriaceae TaxID=204434 RepID=UPI00131B6981|nr:MULTISPECIES: response regulator [Acidobacteriaceae]MDW5267920.1 response regulator [Edaphobacter sp.]
MKNETGPLRIMVVDDDALSREVLALLLDHAGYIVGTADSGDAAVHQLSTMPEPRPHVVLADIQMPGTTGSALAHALRECCGADSLLLAMSGSRPSDDVIRDFDGLLLKPFTMEELSAAIAATNDLPQAARDAVHQNLTLLDQVTYEKLAKSMRAERLEQLYTLCLTDAEERITRMRQLASNKEDVSFRKEAHAIKGGAGLVGAVELQTLAGVLEDDGIQANHVASLDELMISCDRLRRILMARRNI